MSAIGLPPMRKSIPDKIKCSKCKKNKSQQFYSNRQLDLLYSHVNRNTNGAAPPIRCKVCVDVTTDQKTEMECQCCLKWKAKTEFANSMRKTPDNAWCKQCKEVQGQVAPIGEEPDDSLPAVISVRRDNIMSVSDAYDDDDDEDEDGITNPFSSVVDSVSNLSLKSGAANAAGKISGLPNMFNRFSNAPPEIDDDDEDNAEEWENSDAGTERFAPVKSDSRSFMTWNNKPTTLLAPYSSIDDEKSEDEPIFSTRRVPPKRATPSSNPASAIPIVNNSLPRDRTAPVDPDSSIWQSMPMSKPRVAPGGKLPASMAKTLGGGIGVAIGPDGLPKDFDRKAYGDPTARASNSGHLSVTGSRYTEYQHTESRKSSSAMRFGKPTPAPKPTQTRPFNMNEPLKRVVPEPESDSDSDFCE